MDARSQSIRFGRSVTCTYAWPSGLLEMFRSKLYQLSRRSKGLTAKSQEEDETEKPGAMSADKEKCKDAERAQGGRQPPQKEPIAVRTPRK